MELVVRVARKYKKVFASGNNPLITVSGPPEKIIETVKNNIKLGAGPGYLLCPYFTDYWNRAEYIDLAVETAKEYATEVYKGLRK